jgi:endonuclease/exonuclease/phosphatase family metal-dependent hydrolase
MMKRCPVRLAVVSALFVACGFVTPAAAQSDVVIYSSDVSTIRGNWTREASSSGAGGQKMRSVDRGWSSTASALAAPPDYFEATFSAVANTNYRVWLRLRGAGDSKWNESAWVQFSDALTPGGSAVYRISTASGLLVNLERCSGCGIAAWGWKNTSYWLAQETLVRFAGSGSHTIRVQTREDGVEIDQIVLSPARYLSAAPGAELNDSQIVAKPAVVAATPVPTPYSGSPVAIPGTIHVENYDRGGEGIASSDRSAGNAGGVYRSDNVDLATSSGGGYALGWTDPGEWLKYTVNVTAAGSYTANFRVASLGQGGTFYLEMNGTNVSGTLTIPNTGGWQSWQTISKTVTLAAGQQVARLVMASAPVAAVGNFDWFQLSSGAPAPAPAPAPPIVSSTIRVLTWNIHGGTNTSNANVLLQQAQFMIQQNPDVIALQEVSLYGEDQPTKLRNELQRLTGRTWYPSWAPSCSTGACLGNLILSRLPLEEATMKTVYPTAFARARIRVNNVPVDIYSAHLGVPTDRRTNELNQLMSWARSYPVPRLVLGDFNAWWGEWWILQMMTEYYDTWKDVTGSVQNGHTVGNVRFDFIFRSIDGGGHLAPIRAFVAGTSLSDHMPVVADYRVQ